MPKQFPKILPASGTMQIKDKSDKPILTETAPFNSFSYPLNMLSVPSIAPGGQQPMFTRKIFRE